MENFIWHQQFLLLKRLSTFFMNFQTSQKRCPYFIACKICLSENTFVSNGIDPAVREIDCGLGQIYDHLMKLCVSNRPLNSNCPQGYAHNIVSDVCEGTQM